MTTGGRKGGPTRRGHRGVASPRVVLAVVASTLVTLAVAGPMGFQAYETRQDAGRVDQPVVRRTTTTEVPSTMPPSVLPTDEERDSSILWTSAWGVGTGTPLSRSTVAGTVIVYLDVPGATRCEFWLDLANGKVRLRHVDREAPFTMVAGRTEGRPGAFDTRSLPNGTHTVLVEVTLQDGRTQEHIATFTISNG